MNGESNNPQRSLEQISRHAEPAGSSLELSETSASIEGIFYRSCNFCGGAQFRVFKSLDTPFPERIYGDRELTFPEIGRQLKLQYLECSRCGLIGVNPLTRFADINRNSFDGERNIVAWADLDYREYEADKLNEIRLVYDQYEFEKYRETNRILDVSCGPGVSLKWLRDEKGWEVFGIDPDRHSVRMAWDRYGVRIENGLIHDIAAPDEYFDIIIMDNSLEHTFDPNNTLLKIFRLLRKGGGVFIFIPNSHGLSTRFLNANVHWGHWFLFNPKALCLFLKRVGYKVSKLCAVQNPINPALIDKGVDLSPYREGLAVSLIGEEDVLAQVDSVRCYSDFFNLMATKPNDANIGSHAEKELSLLAGSSLIENKAVNIGPGSITVGDVDRTKLDIRSGVEEGEKPALVETQVEVLAPARGGVFAETLDGCLRTKEHLVFPPSQFRASRNRSLAGLRVIKMRMSVAFRHLGSTIAKFNLVNLKKLIHAVKNTDQAWLEAKSERQVSGAASTPMRAETAEFFEARRCQSVEIQNPQCGPSSEEESDRSSVGIFYRACNFCGASEFRVFKALELQFPERIYGDVELTYPDVGRHLKLQYLECTSCGLVGVNPLTRFADINRNSFDGERNIVAWADLDYREYEADKLNEIRLVYDQYEFEKYRETNRILDVSCGPGVSLKWLRDEKGWEVFGIDPDRHSVRMAWDRYGVRIENGLIHDIAAPDEYFDIIIMDNSLEHTFDPNNTLLKIFRLLRKGGGVFIFIPNSHGLSTRFLNANAHWGHWFLFNPKALCLFLKRVGYKVSKLCAVQNPINPALIDKGVDLSPYREGLAVSLIGEEDVLAQVDSVRCYSDFFNLMATKPNDANIGSHAEKELSLLAGSSLIENKAVNIGPGTITGLDQPARKHVDAKLQKFGLIISGCPGGAYHYRCEHQAEQLGFLGLTVDIAYFDQVDYKAALEGYQCYWLHRVPHTDGVEDFILKVQYMGKPVIFDTDDLVFDEENIPYIRAQKWMSQDEVDLYIDGVRRYHRTLSLCRFATVTTEPLRDAVQRLFPEVRCFINSNALSDAQLAQAEAVLKTSRPAEDKDIVRIAYFSGTRTHNVDFQECSSALVRVLENYPNAKVMFVGHLDVGEEFKRFGGRIERYPLLPWQELPRLRRRVDINVAPLELDNPFTEAKSALKYFEAAVMGVPTVASDVKAYQASICHGENGFLCRTEDDWVQCLARLVKDASLRREMGRRAKTDTLETLTTRRQTPHFRSVVKDIFQAGSPSSEKTLSIAFVLRAPIGQVGGGYKNIFRLVNYLADQGHEVNVYVEPIAHLEGKSDSQIIEFCHMYFGESAAEIHVGHDAIKPCDVAIATNWPTAFVVDSLTNTLCKAYLIQDFEPDFYDYESPLYKEAEKTYDLPLKKITLGRHLANLFESKDQLPVASIDFGIDHGIFNNHNRKESEDKVRILFFARPALKRRGFDLGIEALEQVYRNCSTVEICCYGMEEKKALPFPYTNLGILPPAELAKAMRNADIHLSFSLTNISFVPFEAMACGCAVVEARVPPVQAMVEDGTNCVLAEPTANAFAEALLRLVKDSDLRRGLVEAGVEFVQKKTWDNSCEQFREALIGSLFLRPSLESVVLTNSKSLIGSDTHDSNAPLSNKHEIASVSLPCNLCGSEGYNILYGDIPQVYTNSFVVACADCGLKRLEPRMASMDELWSSTNTYIHRDYIPCWSNFGSFQPDGSFDPKGNFHYWHVNVLARIENFKQNGRLLDLGCNIGLLVEAASRAGWEATGIDISEPAIRYGKEKFRVDLRVGQIQDCIFPDEYFDVISLWDVIEHLTDPIGALKRAWTLLRPGGALVIQTPNYGGPSRRLLGKQWEMFATEHFFYFEETTLKRILESADFNEIKFETLGFDRAKVVSILGEDSRLLQDVDEELKTGQFGLDTIIVRAQKPIKPIAARAHWLIVLFFVCTAILPLPGFLEISKIFGVGVHC